MFDNNNFREYMKRKQFLLNERDEFIASCYGDYLTFNEIIMLRNIAIKYILIKYDIEVITDLPWGKGMLEYQNRWEEMMIDVIKTRKVVKE